MNDLIAAAAVIQGAQIQANYALWAAVIGAIGVVIATFLAFKNAIIQIEKNNLLEAKREVYLDFISKYNSLARCYELIKIYPDNFYEMIQTRFSDFEIAIEKTLLLCNSKHKEKIYLFYDTVQFELNSYVQILNDLRVARHEANSNIEQYNKLQNELEHLKKMNLKSDFLEFNFKSIRILDEVKRMRVIVDKRDKLEENLKKIELDLLLNTKKLAIDISILLRTELGLVSDINLEKKFALEFFNNQNDVN